ncbi:MAG: ABC transporter substrate-binding protein [Candidatus Thiodiazotropha sp.]
MTRNPAQPAPITGRLITVLLLWCLLGVAASAERPQRVVSINLCGDQLLLMLADPEQVASVSNLAVEPLSSFVAEQAERFPMNHARAEELIALRPDLVLATAHDSPRLLSTLETLGYRVERLPPADDLPGIVASIRRVAGLLDQDERGETMIRRLRRRLHDSDQTPLAARPTALFYQPRGYTSGRHTLQDQALRLAGWRNLAAEQGIEGYAPVDMEHLLRWQPQQLFTSIYDGSGDSLAERQLLHPALRRLTTGRPLQPVPYRYWICPGPMLADAVALLREARSRLPAAPEPNQ